MPKKIKEWYFKMVYYKAFSFQSVSIKIKWSFAGNRVNIEDYLPKAVLIFFVGDGVNVENYCRHTVTSKTIVAAARENIWYNAYRKLRTLAVKTLIIAGSQRELMSSSQWDRYGSDT